MTVTRHYQGAYLQGGYVIEDLLPSPIEPVVRIGGIWDNDGDNVWEWGFGVNYFPWSSYNCKLAADFIRISEAVGGAASAPNYSLNDEITMIRLMLQVGF